MGRFRKVWELDLEALIQKVSTAVKKAFLKVLDKARKRILSRTFEVL